MSSWWSPTFWLPAKTVCAFLFALPAHLILFDLKLLTVQFSLTSYYFISRGSKYSPQHPVLKHPQFICSSLNVRDKVSYSHKTKN
jgi:hypothetical protein